MHNELNSGEPIYFQEGSLGEILFFRHTELCYIPQAEQYKVKIKDLWCFGGSFKAKPFPMKRKENIWDLGVFSLRNPCLEAGHSRTYKIPILGKN